MSVRPDGDWQPDPDRPGWLREPGRPGWLLSEEGRWRPEAPVETAEPAPAGSSEPRHQVWDEGEERPLATILDDVEALLRRYVVFPLDAQPVAIALWSAHSHAIEAADTTPYLDIHSPAKRSGKSTVLDVLCHLVREPLAVANISEASLFRSIERKRPTVLWDEVDAVFAARTGNDALRGLLNAGHRRGRSALRMGGPKMTEVQDFETFCAKALAGLGRLPDTVTDRSIPIALSRKKRSEPVERNRYRYVRAAASPIGSELEAWASRPGVIDTLAAAEPSIPEINDRAADGWEPLLAIADLAGSGWPAKARAAALTLCGETVIDDSLGTRLLADIRSVFDTLGVDRLLTVELIEALIGIEDAPWAEKWARALRDDPEHRSVGSSLARMLRGFKVRPVKVRIGSGTANGYLRAAFEDVWERYVPTSEAPSPHAERNNGTSQVDGHLEADQAEQGLPAESGSDQGCSVVPSADTERAPETLGEAREAIVLAFPRSELLDERPVPVDTLDPPIGASAL